MNPGSVFFDRSFNFTDGETGRKLFLVLGCLDGIYVVAKTTSNPKRFSSVHGCQPNDRFHNFHLMAKSCGLDGATWICLDELYELKQNETLQKKFAGQIDPICDFDRELTRAIQDCAVLSEDATTFQLKAICDCLA